MQGTHEVAGLLRGRGARVGEGHLGGVLVVVVCALGGHRGSAPAARGAVRRAESERKKLKFVNFCPFFLLLSTKQSSCQLGFCTRRRRVRERDNGVHWHCYCTEVNIPA